MGELRRLTAFAGLILATLTLVGLVLDGAISATTGGPPMIALETLAADLGRVRGSAVWPIETWVYTLQLVPFAVFVVGLRSMFKATGQGPIADVAAVSALLFMALHTLHNLAILAVVQVLAPTYSAGAPDAAATLAVTRSLLAFAYAAFLPGGGVGGLLFVVAMAAFAVAQRRGRLLAPGSGRLAGASAVLLALGYVQYVAAPALFIALIGWLAYLVWTIVVSVGLLRSAERQAAPALVRSAT